MSEDEVIAERRCKAFELRKTGSTYREIAAQCGVSVATAYDDIAAELEDLRGRTLPNVDAVRQLELERVDAILLALWPNRGDHRAATALMRVLERRAKLLGLDAPTKLDPGSGVIGAVLYLPDNGREDPEPEDGGGEDGGAGSLPQA